MQHFIFLLLLLCFASNANAEDSFFSFAAGTASGTEDVAISAPSGLNDKFDHDLKGASSVLTYGSFPGGGWGWCIGYHNYLIRGETTVFDKISSLQFDRTLDSKLQLIGPYFGFGYRFGDGFLFTPQIRIGMNNQIVLDRSLTTYIEYAPTLEFTQKSEENKKVALFVFPLEIMLGDSFSFGAEYHVINLGISSEDEFFGDSTNVTMQSAVMASLSFAW